MHETNRLSWNAATAAHNSHKIDQAAFLRDGGTTLFSEEIELLGDIAGKSLVHLQCNAGQDTLSLAALGATVTGVDISDTAIDFARSLARDSNISARFERADIYEWLGSTDERFDVAFTSYGVLGWLSDLDAWARGVARVLATGGRLVLLEYHSALLMLEDAGDEDGPLIDRLRVRTSYSGGVCLTVDEGVSDYVALSGGALAPQGYREGVEDFENPHPCFEFCWGIEDIVGALLKAGLRLRSLRDYPYVTGWKPFRFLVEVGERRFGLPEGMPRLPFMFGLVADKP